MNTLPIESILPQLSVQLNTTNRVVLVAPPGAGKSTLLPLSLLESEWLTGGEIWLLEPRRIAAEQVARRLADTLDEPLGQTIGLITGDFSKTRPCNKIVVMTEAVLTNRLLNNNEIPTCKAIIFDEFHERNLMSDLGLALTVQCQDYLRDDLKLIVMSATLDSQALIEKLDATLIESKGRSFPVDIQYAIKQAELTLEQNIVKLIKQAINQHQGDLLVFLPGIKEISRVQRLLEENPLQKTIVLPLHGQLPSSEQQTVLKNNVNRKIILASDIAKTSLTIEGVTVVIDCGLERQAKFNTQNAMDELITQQASQASMIQRAGRAGRIQAGTCYRLMSEEAFSARSAFSQSAIQLSDLTPFALTLGAWGSFDTQDYLLLDPPENNRYQNSVLLLEQLGGTINKKDYSLDNNHHVISEHGKQLSQFPIHPRLAHMLLSVNNKEHLFSACLLAAILTEGDPLYFQFNNSDLSLRLELFKESEQSSRQSHGNSSQTRLPKTFEGGDVKFRLAQRIQKLASRLAKKLDVKNYLINSELTGVLCMQAYPDRISQKRGNGYRLRNGQGAMLLENDALKNTDYLSVAHVSSQSAFNSQSTHSKNFIRLGVELKEADIYRYFTDQISVHSRFEMQNTLMEIKEKRLGAIILSSEKLKAPDSAASEFLMQEVRTKGLAYLPLKENDLAILHKFNLAHQTLPDIYPSFEEKALINDLENWLQPFIGKHKIKDIPYKDALLSRVDWGLQNQLKQDFPNEIPLPSGRNASIDYSQNPPVVKGKLQEFFGMTQSPTVGKGKITLNLHLLSPAQKPLAMTHDLAFFWKEAYPEVRKESRGRYAKHPWPEDPLTAIASSKTKKRMENG